MKFDWKKSLPHVVAVVIFLSVSLAYFYPALEGYMVRSHDINMHKGMSKEIADHRETYGEEPLWTNAAFGGMPATQISVLYESNLIGKLNQAILSILPHPINYLFLYMIGFYILLMCMKVDPWLAIAGAIAYGFSSYFFIIMGAGHNSKAVAIAYMAPALGGFLLAYRGKTLLGTAIMLLFMAFQINANHPQVTYYFFILLFIVFVYQAVNSFIQKELKKFILKTGIIGIGVILAVSTNISNLYSTYEYTTHTQRGGTELALAGDTVDNGDKKGMSKDYALLWSYGKGETWNFMIPNIKGGISAALLGNKEFVESEGNNELKEMLQLNYQLYSSRVSPDLITEYFGNQASTSGPVYIGAIVCFLFIIAMIFWQNSLKWPLLIMVILSIALSWGKNFLWLTDIFWDYVPVYNKFRAVTIILVMVELIMPLVGFLWLRDVFVNREKYIGNIALFGKGNFESKKVFIGASSFVGLLMLLFAFMPGAIIELENDGDKAFFNPTTFNEQITMMVNSNPSAVPAEYAGNPSGYASLLSQSYGPRLKTAEKQLITYRETIIQKDALRSFIFILLATILLYFFIYKTIPISYFSIGFSVLLLIDLWGIDIRYFNNEEGEKTTYAAWVEKEEKLIPFTPSYADFAILNNEVANNPLLGNEIQTQITAKKDEKGEVLSYKEDANTRFAKLNQKTNYRVLLLSGGFSQETSISYYHKSLGGYHSAKIQRYQDILDRKMNRQMQLASNPNTLDQANILNMLNTKYIVTNPNGTGLFIDMNNPQTLSQQNQAATPGFINNAAFGNAWFVSKVIDYGTPTDEFRAIDSLNLKEVAAIDESYEPNAGVSGDYVKTGTENISMSSYKANEITYSLQNVEGGDHFVVFSEIYYPLGWVAYVDGEKKELNRVNYTLRGIKIPEGTKEIQMKYELKSYSTFSTLSLIISSLIIIMVLVLGYLSLFKGKDE